MSRGPTAELIDELREAAAAGIDLARLQVRLLQAELRASRRRFMLAASGMAAGLLAIAYGAPLGIGAGAVLIGRHWNFSSEASLAVTGAVLLVLGLILTAAVYRWVARSGWLPRSGEALRRNLDALHAAPRHGFEDDAWREG
jgi:hypothetical protein